MYDVIISGAGPAGCAAAKMLVDAGYSVFVAEKNPLMREKSCNGVLVRKSVALAEYVFGQIPQAVLSDIPINRGLILVNERRVKSTVEGQGLNVWRNLFDYWMAAETGDAGATIRENPEVTGFRSENSHVAVTFLGPDVQEEKGRVLLGCDGTESIVRRTLRHSPGEHIVTYQTYSSGSIDLDPAYFHAYLQKECSGYAAWCCVKDEYVTIAVRGRDSSQLPQYYKKFVEYLTKEAHAKLGNILQEEYGTLPYVAPSNPIDTGEGRIFLAGDAANLLNPICEGISPALVSAYAFAEAYKRISKPGCDPDVALLRDAYKSNSASGREHLYRQWKMLGYASPKFAYLIDI